MDFVSLCSIRLLLIIVFLNLSNLILTKFKKSIFRKYFAINRIRKVILVLVLIIPKLCMCVLVLYKKKKKNFKFLPYEFYRFFSPSLRLHTTFHFVGSVQKVLLKISFFRNDLSDFVVLIPMFVLEHILNQFIFSQLCISTLLEVLPVPFLRHLLWVINKNITCKYVLLTEFKINDNKS